ncbi:MAG: hypothetical protein WBE72_12860 [Terracidiphilus sp.]
MPAEHVVVGRLIALICLPACWVLSGAAFSPAQPGARDALTPAEGQVLVDRALANEVRAAQDSGHPMRYVLRKTSPRLTTTKEIFESKDGDVARLIAINDQPLSAAGEGNEQERLDGLLRDPGLQRHRKQSESADTGRALEVLRALPDAFVYQFAGAEDGPAGRVEKFTFKPNPNYDPPDLETHVLSAMTGEIRIDAASERVVRLEGHLQRDVDFGWGILGRLNKGGSIAIGQANVGGGQWRTVSFKMSMSGRVFIRTRVFDTAEEETQFAPVPVGTGYARAIEILRADPVAVAAGH